MSEFPERAVKKMISNIKKLENERESDYILSEWDKDREKYKGENEMTKQETINSLKELLEDAYYMKPYASNIFLVEGIREIVKSLSNNKSFTIGEVTAKINIDSCEAEERLEILSERIDVINQQIDRAVEELERMKTKINIGVDIDE